LFTLNSYPVKVEPAVQPALLKTKEQCCRTDAKYQCDVFILRTGEDVKSVIKTGIFAQIENVYILPMERGGEYEAKTKHSQAVLNRVVSSGGCGAESFYERYDEEHWREPEQYSAEDGEKNRGVSAVEIPQIRRSE